MQSLDSYIYSCVIFTPQRCERESGSKHSLTQVLCNFFLDGEREREREREWEREREREFGSGTRNSPFTPGCDLFPIQLVYTHGRSVCLTCVLISDEYTKVLSVLCGVGGIVLYTVGGTGLPVGWAPAGGDPGIIQTLTGRECGTKYTHLHHGCGEH